MSHIQTLESIFEFFYNNKTLKFNLVSISNHFHEIGHDINPVTLTSCINKLMSENLIFSTPNGTYYQISFDGLLFFEDGGFKRKHKYQRAQHIWNIAKTTMIVINAFILIAIGIQTCRVTDKSNQLEKEKLQLQQQLDSLIKK